MKKVRGREAAEHSSSVQHSKAHKKVENVNEIAEVESHVHLTGAHALRVCTASTMECGSGACVARTKGMKSSGGFETSDGKRAQVQRFGDKGGIAQVEGYSAQLKTKENAEGRHALLMADGKHELDNGERVAERNERHRMRSAQRPFRLWTEPGGARQNARARNTFSVQGTHEGVFDGCTRAARVHREHNGQMVERRRSIKSVFDGCTALQCLRMGENSDDANDEQHHHHKHSDQDGE
ncbi:hypothetical protein niasHS_012369 [Heterodera schachtii]|uniref:Uncharacterized protein n=1 Tax=Heterodera schachtii TaxID=97005 RepID=A0ABD2IUI1_HETSC